MTKKWVLYTLLLTPFYAFAATAFWVPNTGGLWNDNGNWSTPAVPNGVGDQASFSNLSFPGVVSIDLTGGPFTVDSLNIDLTPATSTSFTFANSQLNFNTSSGRVSCNVINPNGIPLTIASEVNLQSGVDFNIAGGGPADLTIKGEISSVGGFNKLGPGTLVIQGVVQNSTGDVTVTNGTLLLDNSGATRAINGNNVFIRGGTLRNNNVGQIPSGVNFFVDDGEFDLGGFAQDCNTCTYNGGVITLSGATFLFNNTGTSLTMRGNTSFSNGTLSLPNTGTTVRFDRTNNGTATIDAAVELSGAAQTFNIEDGTAPSDMIINGVISNVALIKTGNGTLVLGGTNTYAGTTTVNQGTLDLGMNGSIGGTATINAGGQLIGTGSVFNLVNNGTVNPGNGIGTLNVTGTYNQNSGGNLEIELNDSGASDLLNVTGNVTLDGMLTVDAAPGIYPAGIQYPFMNYAAQVGSLTLIDPTFLDFFIQFGAFGELINRSAGIVYPVPNTDFHGNVLNIAEYLFCRGYIPDNQDLFDVLRALVTVPAGRFIEDLVKLSPLQFGALPLVNLQSNRLMGDAFAGNAEKFFWCDRCESESQDKETCVTERNNTSVWITPIGYYYHQDGINNKPSQRWADKQIPFNAYSIGFGVGADHLFFNFLMVGGGVGYTYSHIDWEKNRGDGHWNSIYFGPYIGWLKNPGFLNLLVLGSYNTYHIDRNIHYPGVHRTASNQHHSYDLLLRLDGGYKFRMNTGGKVDHFFILPEARISYLNIFENGYTESGAGSLNLKVDSQYTAYLQPSVLLKFLRDFYFPGVCMTPVLEIGWISNVPLSSNNYTARLYKQNTCQSHFSVKSFHDTSNQMTIGTEWVFRTDSDWIIEIGYKADIFDNQTVHNGKAKVEKRF